MILVVQSLWNQSITDALTTAAVESLKKEGHIYEVIQVPGALEVPLAIKWAWAEAQRKQKPLQAAVALGCIVKGETHHFDLVAEESSRALMGLSLDLRIPIGHGILAVYDLKQAQARATGKHNKGLEAVDAVLKMLKLKEAKGF